MELSLSLFPYKSKYMGIALMVMALPSAYLYFWGGRPEMFNVPTFAIVTAYAETRFFVIAETNLLDELAAILFITGISLFSFSKEKFEKEYFESLRLKALVKALYISILAWIISFVLIYGTAIFIVNASIFIVFLMCYNILFRVALYRELK